jgi:glycosyltransferase involved in cell wall biosynthesis
MRQHPVPQLSVLVCTYNRCTDLQELLASVVSQETNGLFKFEVLVIDNNSTDDTRAMVTSLIGEISPATGLLIRYMFEPRQGKSYALNTALAAAVGSICIIADDDLIFPRGHLRRVWQAFADNEDVSIVAGKVLPIWQSDVPAWLSSHYWTALALADMGDQPFRTGVDRPVCLLAAAFRRDAVMNLGGYNHDLGVSGGSIGGVEDADVYSRLYRCGHIGLYEPGISVFHKVQPHRVTKRYHRRWHLGHGSQLARMRDPEVEHSRMRILGTPRHLYRLLLSNAARWFLCCLRRDARAFMYETQLWFAAGFIAERTAEFTRRMLR